MRPIPVVTSQEMARIEKLAYAAGASEEEFMERAGAGVAIRVQAMIARYHLEPKILLIAGSGNNGGDGFVAARLLLKGEFSAKVMALFPREATSRLSQQMRAAFEAAGGVVQEITHEDEIDFSGATLIVDGILGTGFHGEITGVVRAAIERANRSKLPILAIDIPSGIDGTRGAIGGVAIKAQETCFLGMAKKGAFIGEAWNNTGAVHVHDFGLKAKYVDQAESEFYLVKEQTLPLPEIVRTRHKYSAGYVVGLGGSPSMPGAALLSSLAALRAGAGIVRLFYASSKDPFELQAMQAALSYAPHELVRESYSYSDLSRIFAEMKRASALFVGPGLGLNQEVHEMLSALFSIVDKPIVIDADALTHLSRGDLPIPQCAILTPHQGEMKRLLGLEGDIAVSDLLERCQQFAKEKRVTLLLKGAPTFVFGPATKPFIIAQGDPGMATAGSGDVLTGIVAALFAQRKIVGFQPQCYAQDAALGALLHGLAGEAASALKTSYSLIASDLIEMLPAAFKRLQAAQHVEY